MRTRRNVNEIGRAHNYNPGRGRGFNHGGKGRGGSGRGRRGYGHPRKTRSDSTFITLTDGQRIEYHPSFKFPAHIFNKMKQIDIDTMKHQRFEYKQAQSHQSSASVHTQIQALQRQLHGHQQTPMDLSITPTNVSQVTTGTMMGGRNEQAHSRSSNSRSS